MKLLLLLIWLLFSQLCLLESIQYKTDETINTATDSSEYYLLYPNPAGEQATFIYKNYRNTDGLVSITDGSGRLINEFVVKSNNGFLEISTRGLATGLYYLRYRARGEVVYENKLAVIR